MHPNMNFGTTLVVFAFPSIMGLEDHIKNVLQKKNFGTKVLRSRSKIGNIGHHFVVFETFLFLSCHLFLLFLFLLLFLLLSKDTPVFCFIMIPGRQIFFRKKYFRPLSLLKRNLETAFRKEYFLSGKVELIPQVVSLLLFWCFMFTHMCWQMLETVGYQPCSKSKRENDI